MKRMLCQFHGRKLSPIATRAALSAALWLASLCILASCASAATGDTIQNASNTNFSNTSSSSQVNVTSASSTESSDDSWRTISESSVASVSIGGGSNRSDSQSSVSVRGAYRVLAACGGSGSLNLALRPGGSVTVRCSSEGDPARVAGGDTAPLDGILSLDVRPSGTVTDADILIQERR